MVFGFGAGKSDIYLYNIQCTGNETNLLECMYGEFGEHNCFPFHVRGPGVSCGKFPLNSLYIIILILICI